MVKYETADTRQQDNPARQRTIEAARKHAASARKGAPLTPEKIAARMKEIQEIEAADAEKLRAYGVQPWKPDPELQKKIDRAKYLADSLEQPERF